MSLPLTAQGNGLQLRGLGRIAPQQTQITGTLPRQFDLKVHIGSGGYQATGTARFICHPDSTGEYYIYRWIDESDQH